MHSTEKTPSDETTLTPTEKADRETRQENSTIQEVKMVLEKTLDKLAIRNTGGSRCGA
jgi:hypothetical protein